jgi:hypothetical protein
MFLHPNYVTNRIIGLILLQYRPRKQLFFLIHHLPSLCQQKEVVICLHLLLPLDLRSSLPIIHFFSFQPLIGFIYQKTIPINYYIIPNHLFHLPAITLNHQLKQFLHFLQCHLIFNQYFKYVFLIIDNLHYFHSFHSEYCFQQYFLFTNPLK